MGRLLPRRPIRLPAGTHLLAELLYGCLHYGFREFPPCAFAACGRSYPDIHAAGQAGLPREDLEERLTFYSEMLDDQMEEGLSEEEAVAAVGPVDEIVRQIIADTPLAKLAKERMRPRRQLKAWEIVLLVLASPLWLSLGLAAIAVIFAFYVVLWSVSVSLWAVFASLAVCAVGGLPAFAVLIARSGAAALAILAAGMVCAGLAIFCSSAAGPRQRAF